MTYDDIKRELKLKLTELSNPDNTCDTGYIAATVEALRAIEELEAQQSIIDSPLGNEVVKSSS